MLDAYRSTRTHTNGIGMITAYRCDVLLYVFGFGQAYLCVVMCTTSLLMMLRPTIRFCTFSVRTNDHGL